MKRFLTVCILAALMLNLFGCASNPPEEAQTVPAEITTEVIETTQETTIPTEPELYDGFLFLTVSSITFSLVGESEDIYLGSIPREEVVWESADESVVAVQDGVLTAVGVGTTTVSATYGDQRMECTAGCLAETEDDLKALSNDILRSPKRLPPVYDDEEITYFDDSAIVGDSISYIMFQWESQIDFLGDPLFLVRGGISINGLVNKFKLIYYQGKEMCLEDALAAAGVKKVFIMLGQNDLSYMTIEDTMANWGILVERIRENSPDIEIYIQSCIPEWEKNRARNDKNEKIDEANTELKVFCEENDCHFIDLAPYAEDHENKMPTCYSLDESIHMNYDGCYAWMQVLRAYAVLQNLEGE